MQKLGFTFLAKAAYFLNHFPQPHVIQTKHTYPTFEKCATTWNFLIFLWSPTCIVVPVGTLALNLLKFSKVEGLRQESLLSAGCEKSLYTKLDDWGLEPSLQPSYHWGLQRA